MALSIVFGIPIVELFYTSGTHGAAYEVILPNRKRRGALFVPSRRVTPYPDLSRRRQGGIPTPLVGIQPIAAKWSTLGK